MKGPELCGGNICSGSSCVLPNLERWLKTEEKTFSHRILPGEANTALLEVGKPVFDGQVNIIQAHLINKQSHEETKTNNSQNILVGLGRKIWQS